MLRVGNKKIFCGVTGIVYTPIDMSQPSPHSPANATRIELWNDNWSWSMSEPEPGVETETGESEHPDDSGRTPLGLSRLGRMVVDLRAECGQLRGAVLEMEKRITMLEAHLPVSES